jgi:beta-lactam-binding protein with PASTA domain/serine/threonine protein kinase
VGDELPTSGAPQPGPYEDTPRLADTVTFPAVFGAGMATTSIADPMVGHVLDGRYHITARLARGGMATVYQGVDTRLTRTVAIKLMHVGLGDDAEFARKLDREARAAARLSHRNVVSVFDQGRDDSNPGGGRPYIVMEFVDGHTLRDVINRDAPLSPLRCLELMDPVLAALAAAHDAGLVHRDVKPENVLISDRGQIKVADFGLAKAVSSQTSTATQGLLIGTVSYLPPELVMSGKADARSDVYSAGVVLFELLTGRKPHTGETPIQVAYAHVNSDVPAPSSMRTAARIPPYLDALVTRATSRNRDARPPNARVFLTQLRRVRAALSEGLADDPDLTRELTRIVPVAPSRKRDRADYEVTQRVSDMAGISGHRAPATPPPPVTAQHPPRTILDAPPPAVPERVYQLSAARQADQRQRQARSRRRGWLALILVLIVATSAALAGWYWAEGRFTTAPALTMLTESEAGRVAKQAGLRIDFKEGFSETIAKGRVISTDPAAGARLRDGAQMHATVSKGPERYAMPVVGGLSRTDAVAALKQARLDVGKIAEEYSRSVLDGTVLRASERAGTLLRKGTDVDLVVSRGPQPLTVVNYEGTGADTAIRELKQLGFAVAVSTERSETVARGLVIRQSPRGGTGIRGDTINITRSLGPNLVTVPNVRSMEVRAAEQVMKKAGFKTEIKASPLRGTGTGFVVYTTPRARSQVPKGSTITLFVI